MKDHCLAKVKAFLEEHLTHGPLVLAVSGGSDSMALLELMRAAKQFFDLELHIAHVDHGLREESALEAKQLSKLDLPFHTIRLGEPKGNIEEWCREQRYTFFGEVVGEVGAQALVTAHHLGDVAETVLKRTLEGARLDKLGGLKTSSELYGTSVWRPLLGLRKDELATWLQKRAFDDSMNYDCHYLRARMRKEIMPSLEKQFGKSIDRTLGRLATRSHDLSDYLDRKIKPYLDAFDGQIDFGPFFPLEKIEVLHFLHAIANREGESLTFEQGEVLFKLLQSKAFKKEVTVGGLRFACHGARLSVDKIESLCYGST